MHQPNTRRNIELGLLAVAAVPVLLLYAMYVTNMAVELSVASLAVPIGLCAAFVAAHVADGIDHGHALQLLFAHGADGFVIDGVFHIGADNG